VTVADPGYTNRGQGRGAAGHEPRRCPYPEFVFFSMLDIKMATLGAFWIFKSSVVWFKRKKELLLGLDN